MKVLVGLSGGVDSTVAALLLQEQGHEVVGVTMKLWGGTTDSGCCSLADVEDAKRVATQLGIAHYVFNFAELFTHHVVETYVDAHRNGLTPNPCIECNRSIKFPEFLRRARQVGFDAIATGHYARVVSSSAQSEFSSDAERSREVDPGRSVELRRGIDEAKDQSYVLHALTHDVLRSLLLPLGELTKSQVRDIANARGFRTATKPDSQDVCFIEATPGGRHAFLAQHITLHPGELVDEVSGSVVGTTDAVELVTQGQRKGMGGGTPERRYAVNVDVTKRRVIVGNKSSLFTDRVALRDVVFIDETIAPGALVSVQSSAHGKPVDARYMGDYVQFCEPQRKVAPGQSVVFYENDRVLGGGIATRDGEARDGEA